MENYTKIDKQLLNFSIIDNAINERLLTLSLDIELPFYPTDEDLQNIDEDPELLSLIKRFNELMITLYYKNVGFSYASFDNYVNLFKIQSEIFKSSYIDSNDIDFINSELQKLEVKREKLKSKYLHIRLLNEINIKIYTFTLNRIEEFLKNKLNQSETSTSINEIEPLNFKGSQTQLMELIKALVESDLIEGTQTNTIKQFSNFFNKEINNPSKLIQDIKGKNNDSKTAFLDLLKTNLNNYLMK